MPYPPPTLTPPSFVSRDAVVSTRHSVRGKRPITSASRTGELLNKLVPYQAGIGVGLLGLGLFTLLRWIGSMSVFFKHAPLFGIALFGSCFVAMALGFFFGMPLIAKWIPGDSPAEEKAETMAKKLAPFQTILGIAGIVCGLLLVLYRMNILKIG